MGFCPPSAESAVQVQPTGPISDTVTRPIVFVCLVFHPDTSASSILFTDLFTRLSRDGVRVTALCGFPSKDEIGSLPRRETYGGVHIVRCGARIQGKRHLLARAVAYGSFLLHAGWKLILMGPRVRVVGGTDPPFTAAALWLLSLTGRVRYEAILLDAYPDGLVAIGSLSERSPITRVWRWLNRRSYARADRLVVIGRDMIDLLRRRYAVDPRRITYIPHWGSTEVDALAPPERGPLIRQLGLDDKFVVQYSGNMGLWHDMDSLVRAADLVRDDPGIHFLFIGKGRRRTSAEALARRLELSNVTWLDFLPREELAAGLSSCDAALISLRAGLEGVAVPSKLYGILASGRPVIAQVPAGSEVASVVREEGCGVVVPPGDVARLAQAIRDLAAVPELAAEMGRRAHHAYWTKYTLTRAAADFQELWQSG